MSKHPLLAVVGFGLGAALIAGAIAGNNNQSASGSTSDPATTAPAPAPAQLSSVGYDGDFKFVVQGTTCYASGSGQVDGGTITVPAGAQECFVKLSVTNDKSEAQTYFTSNQYAYDGSTQFSADDMATFEINDSNDSTQLNPGISITAVVPFQLPTNDQITSLKLHDSAFSGGVTVAPSAGSLS